MSSFETYEGRQEDQQGSAYETELVQSSLLQRAWAEQRTRDKLAADEDGSEGAVIEWILATGEWFRHNVMEYESAPGEPSRKEHFLGLFNDDPEAAVEELNGLFNATSH
ncbi:MAG: hypothetical protein WBO92_02505 [Candidatus Moraniibacteriota bacterium]